MQREEYKSHTIVQLCDFDTGERILARTTPAPQAASLPVQQNTHESRQTA